VVHEVGKHSRELHAYLFIDNKPLLDTQIQVEVSQPTNPAASATSAVETEQQRPNAVIDRNRIAEEVHVALWSSSDCNPVRIGASHDVAIGLRASDRRRRRKHAVLIAVSEGGTIFTAKVLTVVVGDALQRLACTRCKNRRERPATGKPAQETVLLPVVRNLIHDKGVEDDSLIEALTAVLLA
jgi:hypothetical protein